MKITEEENQEVKDLLLKQLKMLSERPCNNSSLAENSEAMLKIANFLMKPGY